MDRLGGGVDASSSFQRNGRPRFRSWNSCGNLWLGFRVRARRGSFCRGVWGSEHIAEQVRVQPISRWCLMSISESRA